MYALYKERESLGCKLIPDGTDCDNANGKAIKGTKPISRDNKKDIKAKIKKAANFADIWVIWRGSLITATVCSILIFYILNQKFPTEKELLVSIIIITGLVYFMLNFYKFHLINYARDNIITGLTFLEK